MPSTVTLVVATLGFLLLTLVPWAMFLRVGLWWASATGVTMRRVAIVTLAVFLIEIALRGLLALVVVYLPSGEITVFFLVLFLGASVAIPFRIISRTFKTHFLRTLQAWLPTLLAPVAALVFVLFVFEPYLFEAFVLPTNSMAPTLVGTHLQGTCSECGQPNYCSVVDEKYASAESRLMICDNFHVTQSSVDDKEVHSSDRFMVAKFYAPRRWDLVVFQVPQNPEEMYVKRLVGLPGEEIHIDDGAVWVDGKRQTPPDSIQGLEYLSELPGPGPGGYDPEMWGSVERPALLADDEYFVLGDFSAQAMDSRLWLQGAPGHNSYGVPESHLSGVVTHTYWPPRRWRVHR